MKEFVEKLIGRLEELYDKNDKAKKRAYEEQDWENFELFMHGNEGVKESIEIVNQLTEEYNNCWIPCSERLPEKPANYLVCSKGVVWMANYFNYTWWGVEKKIRWQDVEAWMPLPAPYQKGE